MPLELNETQVDELLYAQVIGRIGCSADGITYIVPVNYVYDGVHIYARSANGMKVDIMRQNPHVCFEVEDIRNIVNWQSAIVWGTFEELKDLNEKNKALRKLTDRMMRLITSETGQPAHGVIAYVEAAKRPESVWYRIKIKMKSGRFKNN